MMDMRAFLLAALLPCAALAQQGQPGGHFLENWDLDGDGTVTLTEAQSRRSDVFASFDADEDGFLDSSEYALFDEARGNDLAEMGGEKARAMAGGQGKGPMARVMSGLTLSFNDVDGDGKVSSEEFAEKSKDWLALLDMNADGKVTKADFAKRP